MCGKGARKCFYFVAWCLFLVMTSGCISIQSNPARSGDIYVENPIVAKGTDEQNRPLEPATVFRTNDKRIYCTIEISGPDHVRLGARWYYGQTLISDKVMDLGTQRRAAWWLEMAPGQKFPVGEYRIEIYLTKDALKTANFQVVE